MGYPGLPSGSGRYGRMHGRPVRLSHVRGGRSLNILLAPGYQATTLQLLEGIRIHAFERSCVLGLEQPSARKRAS